MEGMNFVIKNKESSLVFFIIIFSLLLIGLTGYAFMHGSYYLAHEDETIFYNSARLFAQTGSVRAEDCINETVAKVWQCNWYGPMYSIFYGTIAKIAGVN